MSLIWNSLLLVIISYSLNILTPFGISIKDEDIKNTLLKILKDLFPLINSVIYLYFFYIISDFVSKNNLRKIQNYPEQMRQQYYQEIIDDKDEVKKKECNNIYLEIFYAKTEGGDIYSGVRLDRLKSHYRLKNIEKIEKSNQMIQSLKNGGFFVVDMDIIESKKTRNINYKIKDYRKVISEDTFNNDIFEKRKLEGVKMYFQNINNLNGNSFIRGRIQDYESSGIKGAIT